MGTAQQLLIVGGGIHDSAFSTVVQLAHFDGSNGSTTFTNSCPRGNTIAAGSLDTIATAQSVFGGASMRRSTGTLSASANHSDYQFGNNDFTIEFRYRPDSVATVNIFDMRQNGAGTVNVATIYTLSNGTLIYFAAGADRITSATGVIAATTWAAIAVSRVSGTTRMFVDGTQVGSDSSFSINYVEPCRVTLPSWTSAASNVYYDELRISNGAFGSGAGRYATNYTIAVAPFPDS
jgi:hypothetical protein